MQNNLIELTERPGIQNQLGLYRKYLQFAQLLYSLKEHALTGEVTTQINAEITQLNSLADSDPEFKKTLRKTQKQVLKWVYETHKLVPINHYRNMWLALGMVVFGIPLGIAFGASLKNMAFLSIGFPIGMVMGMVVGMQLDKKAVKENKQLMVEIKE